MSFFAMHCFYRSLQKNVELLTGVLQPSMLLELKNVDGKVITQVTNDASTLADLQVKDGMILHVIDTTGAASELDDLSRVPKYNISDEEYQKRQSLLRHFLVRKVHFKAGVWIGITYDEPLGKHDGSVDGQRYFQCQDKHGVFVSPRNVIITDEAEVEAEKMDEL
ncbi:unnamed protein product [Soboliphyme baturini]|uniref:CAP-Gly domain-containing protein n=1 Tax=Soboliphyme baturini TaxID=241478 RepID=A0A183ICW5_9BILA|nr:unnamed protein product [Soboliphyme baturini]